MQPMVSVIIAVFNKEKYLNKCISSVLQQTYQDFEIVLVNDGSTDGSNEIIKKYTLNFPGKVTNIEKENGGVSSARNSGISIAKGKYITFLDADDYIEKHYLEILVAVAEKNCCDVVCSGQYKVSENGEIIHKIVYKPCNGQCLMRRLNFSGKIYLTSYIRENNATFPEGKLYEDNSFNIQMFFLSKKILFLDYVGYFQVVHEGSITSKPIQIEQLPLEEWSNCIKKVLDDKKEGVDIPLFEFTVLSFFTYILLVRNRKREYLDNQGKKSNINNACQLAEYFQKITNYYFPEARKNKYTSIFKYKELSIVQRMGVKVFSIMCHYNKLVPFTRFFYKLMG